MSVLSRLFQKEKPVEPVVDEPMAKPIPKLHIFVDGRWLYRACGWKGSLANKLADANTKLNIDFYKLKSYLLEYARKVDNVE